MRRPVVVTAVVIALVGMIVAVIAVALALDDSNEPRYLTVVNGTSGSIDGDTLMLEVVSSVVYFGDRPSRIAGHVDAATYIEAWTEGDDSFAEDPPNAVLSVLGEDTANDVVIELTSIEGDDAGALTFGIIVIDGVLPQGAFGPAALFVDDATLLGLVCRCS